MDFYSDSEFLLWEDDIGNAVILKNGFYSGNFYLRFESELLNGGEPNKFFTVQSTGGAFSSGKVKCGFDNPHNPSVYGNEKSYHNGHLYTDKQILCLDIGFSGPFFFTNPKKLDRLPDNIVPIPEIRVKNYDKFFIGPPEAMRELKILDLVRYRDGGTTIIKTERGELYVPTPFKKGKPDYIIKFNGKIFDECPEAFTVEENGSVAKVNLIKADILGIEDLDRR
jgi:hypothetical protein